MKIDDHVQTIWKSTLELLLSCPIWMDSKFAGRFPQKSTIVHWAYSKMHQIKKQTPLWLYKLFDNQLCFYVENYLFVKKHRKIDFVIFLRRFTSSNFFLFEFQLMRLGQNLMTWISYEDWESSLFRDFSLTNYFFTLKH